MKQEVERLQASMRTASNERTVADVESELEALETSKRNADNRKDTLLNKQNRLRCQLGFLLETATSDPSESDLRDTLVHAHCPTYSRRSSMLLHV